MTPEERETIEAAGFKVGSVEEFLGLTEEESRAVEENVSSRVARPIKTHEFTIILADVDEITVEIADALYEAGCDDSSPSSCEGIVSVHFHREAASLGDAVGSAIGDVERAGFKVASIAVGA